MFPGRTRDYYCTQIVVSREEFAEKLKPLKYTNTQAHGSVASLMRIARAIFFQLLQNKRPHCAATTTTSFMCSSLDAFVISPPPENGFLLCSSRHVGGQAQGGMIVGFEGVRVYVMQCLFFLLSPLFLVEICYQWWRFVVVTGRTVIPIWPTHRTREGA